MDVSPDTAVNVLAVVVAACIGVLGSWIGARQGAEATRTATVEAIAAERTAEQERRHAAQIAILAALATECRANARHLKSEREYQASRPWQIPLERVVLDAAVLQISDIPPDKRSLVEDLLERVIEFNFLVAADDRLRQVQLEVRAMQQELEELTMEMIPILVGIATQLESTASRSFEVPMNK